VGIDPGLYSKHLMAGIIQAIPLYKISMGFLFFFPEAKKAVDVGNVLDTTEILAHAFEATSHIPGSSTGLIVMLDGDELRASNLGDSGFLIIRDGQVVYRSKEQQHSFNCPFQLGTDSTDLPYHADRISFPLQEDDLIVVGTDGLLDNLFDGDIVDVVVQAQQQNLSLEQTARELAKRASEAAQKRVGMVPFGLHARDHGYIFVGGKLDDITVVVAKPLP